MTEAQLTWLDKELLSSYIEKIPPQGIYVEIGVMFGGSAELARTSNPNILVYGVDPNPQLRFTDFHLIQLPSVEAEKHWNHPIDLLFIDGDHDSAGEDFRAWNKWVVDGGFVFFHDYAHHSGLVVSDCDEIIKDKNWKLIRRPQKMVHDDSSLFIIQRCPKSQS